MTPFLSNLSIRGKITALLFMPVLALLYFSAANIVLNIKTLERSTAMTELAQLAIDAGAVVHALQLERTLSAASQASPSAQSRAALTAQRSGTDARIETLNQHQLQLGELRGRPNLSTTLDPARDQLAHLSALRRQFDSQTTPRAAELFIDLNATLLDLIAFLAHDTGNAHTALRISSLTHLLHSKERANIEATLVSQALQAGSPATTIGVAQLIALQAQQDAYNQSFFATATNEQQNRFINILNGANSTAIAGLRAMLIHHPSALNPTLDALKWARNSGAFIEQLRDLEITMGEQLLQLSLQQQANAQLSTVLETAAAFLTLFVCLFMGRTLATEQQEALLKIRLALQSITAGDFSAPLHASSTDEIGETARATDRARVQLGTWFAELGQSAGGLTAAYAEIDTQTDEMSQSTHEQSAELLDAVSELQQLSSCGKNSAENASEAASAATEARSASQRGNDIAKQLVHSMGEIGQASSQIADINNTIDEIAFQTNLLALNAAVEAARAGESGRGFAVVATEVRSLAGRASEAAKRITSLIDNAVKRVDEGTAGVDKSEKNLLEIADSVDQVSSIVEQISQTSKQQHQDIDSIEHSLLNMRNNCQQQADKMLAAQQSSQHAWAETQRLNQLLAKFTLPRAVAP